MKKRIVFLLMFMAFIAAPSIAQETEKAKVTCEHRIACTHKAACTHIGACSHIVACSHAVQCSHRVPCSHYGPCRHVYNTPYGPRTQHRADLMHRYDTVHAADAMHSMGDIQHPRGDVQHAYDLQHAYHSQHEYDIVERIRPSQDTWTKFINQLNTIARNYPTIKPNSSQGQLTDYQSQLKELSRLETEKRMKDFRDELDAELRKQSFCSTMDMLIKRLEDSEESLEEWIEMTEASSPVSSILLKQNLTETQQQLHSFKMIKLKYSCK